jgi:hypothetical protein
MAREVRDREDLLREATGLVERVELRVSFAPHTIVCGFRAQGELSVYWGQDEVAQFNRQAEFRRGFKDGKLVASYRRQLFWLVKQPAGGRASLHREPFSAAEQTRFMDALEENLELLQDSLEDDASTTVVGQVPAQANVVPRLATWLKEHRAIQLAMHPGLGGRRE